MAFELTEIPRRKTSFGGEGGPLVIPPGAQHLSGTKKCETCGRMVKKDGKYPRKGSCKCLWYQRTTTFIDVLQDEFLLKQWGNRNVAYGMSQRPDLILQASSCGPDQYGEFSNDSKSQLNIVAQEAQRHAGDKIKATIGTSLHRLTHSMDRGEELGLIPDRWVADLAAYDEMVKALGIQWVSVESFRVGDWWVTDRSECDHKAVRYGGTCQCLGVAGTVDRIGWYRGRLRVFDIKTGSDFNKLGHAMQLAGYAHMVPYEFPGDTRGVDVDQVDLDVAYIIKLPEGKGTCDLVPYNIEKGWAAFQLAKQVWDARKWTVEVDRDPKFEICDIASRTTTLLGLRKLWKVSKEDGFLDGQVKKAIEARVKELKAEVISA